MYPLRDNSIRAREIIKIFYIYLSLTVINIGISLWQYFLFRDFYTNPQNIDIQKANLSDTIDVISGIVGLAFQIITIVFFIRWFRRAYWNLHQVGTTSLSFSEGWAAGAWFVPILSLFRPYQIMSEIWRGTQQAFPHRFPAIESSYLVGWWWAFYLVMNIGENVIVRWTMNVNGLDELSRLAFANFIIELVTIPAIFLTIQVIKRVSEFEQIAWEEAQNPTESIFAPDNFSQSFNN